MFDIIIVGAGPAGLTSALYALRANKKVLILEGKNYGGQIINAKRIDNYPGMPHISGFEFANILYNQVKELGAEIKYEKVIGINKDGEVITNKSSYKGRAIILATGAVNRKLNLENEDKYIGKGISYCATCDGNFYKNRIVAVNGGKDMAVKDALYLADIASKVYLIYSGEDLLADEVLIEELKSKSNIVYINNSIINKINGDESLKSILLISKDKKERKLEIDGLFVAVGQVPQNEIFSNVIKLDSKGYIETCDGVHTNIPNIFVAGDARNKELRQLVTATADGATVASIIIKELNNK